MAKNKRYEFKPDREGASWISRLYLTPLQRQHLLKWGLYAAVLVFALLLQDTVFAKFKPLGGTVALVPAVILLTAVLQDEEKGGLFALLAALFFQFSGSAPGRYVIALLPTLAVFATIFRESFLRRGLSSGVLCAGTALLVYQLCVFGLGLFLGQTIWSRWPAFLSSAVQGWISMLLLYPALQGIGKIGGDAWKE